MKRATSGRLGLPVVGLDLGGQRVPGQAQVLDEPRPAACQSAPGTKATCAPKVPVAPLILPRYSASTFSAWRRASDRTASSLAERGGGGRLAVRARRHGGVGGRSWAMARQVLDQTAGGQQPPVDGGADRQGVGEIVDVLAGAEGGRSRRPSRWHGGVRSSAPTPGACVRPEWRLSRVLDGLGVVAGRPRWRRARAIAATPKSSTPAQVGLLRLAEAGAPGRTPLSVRWMSHSTRPAERAVGTSEGD